MLFLPAYTGHTCSEDKNGCAEVECFKGVECLDVPAPGVGAECGACDTGFTGDGLKCSGKFNVLTYQLVDNCDTGFTGDGLKCSGLDVPARGIWVECGIRGKGEKGCIYNMPFCSDLDECAQDTSLCDQVCNNTFGSYICSCEPGYLLVGEDCEGKRMHAGSNAHAGP